MPATSAGILMFRRRGGAAQVLLAHPGGPFWRHRNEGAWMLPKGELASGEQPADAARREFEEELGAPALGALHPLGRLRQKGGKWIEAFALEGEFDPVDLHSNLFELQWPPRSGRVATFAEVDRVAWFTLAQARRIILPSQAPLLDRLQDLLDTD
ncbi:MAG: NUDIX domain-containing protein [Frateuria sp.]|uniref:NUDIX domain-containing protein n=1 Tax=Frateuria sp. TaxID=2211372 RepID=UPI00180714D5|nr:NUDIX domain-containing protein [Frateuria sp.]NUO71904.1 NUDIX domain-containing protein [Frateuria sp.]NUR24076.1 NUDIX domain-containing protein [Frateuria sp.]